MSITLQPTETHLNGKDANHISNATTKALNQIEQKQQSPEVSESQTQILPLKHDDEGKKQLAVSLHTLFDTLKLFGKEPDSLENVVKVFLWAVADYPHEKIREALAYYVKHYTEFPAPADIVNIIERGNKPPFERSIYVAISQKRGDERSADEWQYKRDYEKWMLEG